MQLNNDEVIAVKTPKLISPQIKERFQKAVLKQGRLKHPHIIKSLHYLESPEGQPFYMLENQQGVTLEEILQSVEKLDDEDAIALILTQTSSALEYAHNHQCTHDRLTPHNILLIDENEQLQVKVCDFQIAAVADIAGDTTSKTRAFAYLSPETLSGETITAQSDVYSLGAIAFRMATGHLPFDGRGRADSEQSPEPLARFSPELKRVHQLNDIVQEALDAEPQYRTDSVATFKQAIQEWIQAVHADDAAEPEYVTAEMPVPDFSQTSLPEQTIQAAPPEPERIVDYRTPAETSPVEIFNAGFEPTPQVVPEPALSNAEPEVTAQQKRRIRRAQSRTGPQRIRSTIRELVALKKKQSNQEQTVVMKFTEQVAAQTAGPRRSPIATIARLVGFIVICGGLTVGCITYILTNPTQVREMYFQASRQLSMILPGRKTEIEEPVIEEGPKIVLEKPKRDATPPQRKLKPHEIHTTPQPWAIPRLPGQENSSYNNPSSGVTNNSAQAKRRPSRVRIEYLNYDDRPK
jgi:serine/threonine protein kinase